MNTQNPTFPFYGKTKTDAIFKFDSEHKGICVKESCMWKIGETWGEDAVSCLDVFYILPLNEQEIKDNNLPELPSLKSEPENKMNPSVTFPLRARYNRSDLIIEFTSEFSGSVVSGGMYSPGHHSDSWIYGCFDPDFWTILATETKENKKEMKLPDEFYILTENPEYSAAIQKKLFALGYSWQYYQKGDIENTHAESLVVEKNKIILHSSLNFAKGKWEEITMAELFAIPNPKPAFVEEDINFHGYEGIIKEGSLEIGCQTIKYDNLGEIAKKVEEFMSLEFELPGMFKDQRTQTKINHNGITVIAGGETKTIPFAGFIDLTREVNLAAKPASSH